MANFKQHLAGGVAVGVVGSSISLLTVGLSITQSALVFILGCLGGVLPDIDSDTSKPIQMIFGYLGVILPITVLTQLHPNGAMMETVLLMTVIGYFLVRNVLSTLFLKLTTHRGIVHSLPATVICGQVMYLLFHESAPVARVVFAVTCAIGFLVHLILDEIWSVNLMGLQIKRSFGSALALTANSKTTTALAYFMILFLGIVIYIV